MPIPYTFNTLSSLPVQNAFDVNSDPSGINNAGEIVGTYNNPNTGLTVGYLYSAGMLTNLIDPSSGSDFPLTAAAAINDLGQIVGRYNDGSGSHGFLDSDGSYTSLDDPLGIGSTVATGINNLQQIVGNYSISSGSGRGSYGFLYSGGTYTTIDAPSDTGIPALGIAATASIAGINDLSQIVGSYIDDNVEQGFLYSGGSYTTLSDPSGDNRTVVTGINDAGQVVGWYDGADGLVHGFIYSGGSYTTIDDPAATAGTIVTGINNEGEIIGVYADGGGGHVFVATPSTLGPNVTSISAPTGKFHAGQTIVLTVSMSETVTVTNGNPTLTLNDGGIATYLNSLASNELQFTYTVGATDKSEAALAVTGVALNGATIADAFGNSADLSGAVATLSGTQIIASVVWVGPPSSVSGVVSGGDWSTAADWSSASVPGSKEYAILNASTKAYTVVSNSGELVGGIDITDASATLKVNAATFTIDGPSTNAGMIIFIDNIAPVTNTGTLEASNPNTLAQTGGLSIQGTTVNNAGGVIEANDSQVQLQAADIAGGTLKSANGGEIEILQSQSQTTFDGTSSAVVNSGDVTLLNGAALQLQGVIDNAGTITLISTGYPGTTLRATSANATLEGGGQIALGDNSGNEVTGSTNASTLTNVDNTISGAGHFSGLTLVNQASGIIDATYADNALIINTGGTVTNDGLLEANAGTLTVNDTVNGDGTVTGTVQGSGPTVSAGGITTFDSGGGAVLVDSGVTVSDLGTRTLASAAVTIASGGIAGDTLTINGTTSGTINDGASGTIQYSFSGSTLTLTGDDTVDDYQTALDSVAYSFSPAGGDATAGGTDTARTVSWQVNDGSANNGGSNVAISTLSVPATPVVTVPAANVNATPSETLTSSQLFSASDAEAAPILSYEVEDESSGPTNGFWVLNGVVEPNGQLLTLSAAQFSELRFVAGSAPNGPALDTLEVRAADSVGYGAFATFTVTASQSVSGDLGPVVSASNIAAFAGSDLASSTLFSATASTGHSATSYEVEDISASASGYWIFNGIAEPANQPIDVTVTQLAELSFQAGFGTDTLEVRASDGNVWSAFTTFQVQFEANAAPPANTTADLLMRRASDGMFEIYDLGNNSILGGYELGQVGTEWQVAGFGDFDGTDTSDMLLRNANTGAFEIYDISNNAITHAAAMGQVGLEWSVSGFGDFSSRANETDMLMRNNNTGQFEIYDLANNTITFAAPMGQVGLEWSVAGFGDFSTRANETDMLMRNNNTGQFEIYDISNNTLTSAAPMGQVGLEWSVAGFGDFSTRSNETDMLMRNSNTGQFELYDISNNMITSAAPMGQVGLEWSVAGFGPINDAGQSDMLMRNTNTGAFEVYDIANNIITNATGMGQVGLEWTVAGIVADPPSGAAASSAQLTQAMASFGTSTAASSAAVPILGSAEQSQQTLLTPPIA